MDKTDIASLKKLKQIINAYIILGNEKYKTQYDNLLKNKTSIIPQSDKKHNNYYMESTSYVSTYNPKTKKMEKKGVKVINDNGKITKKEFK